MAPVGRISFLIAIETTKEGATITTLEPKMGKPSPEDYFNGCLSALASIYIASCEGTDDDLTAEEFAALVAAKIEARLENCDIEAARKARTLQ